MARLRVDEARRDDKAWIARVGRAGYAVKGITYMLLAFLAVRAAFGDGRAEDTQGALRQIDGPTGGEIVLIGIGAGLFAYALWKLYNAAFNPEDRKVWARLGAAVTGLINGGLAFEAARMGLSGVRQSDGGNQAAHWSALVMGHPFGVVAVGAVGLGIAAYGAARIYRGISAKLDKQLRLQELEPTARRAVTIASRIGIAARGVVFILVGLFLIRAALGVDPAQAKDFGHSLRELEKAPSGPLLLAAVAAGLFLYGVYQLVRSKYRRFVT